MSSKIITSLSNILGIIIDAILSISSSKNKNTEGMGVNQEIDSILQSLKEQPPAIHDLKIKISGIDIYEILNDGTRKIIPRNKGIILKPLSWGNIMAKIIVYPNNTIHIDLGCTFQPYPYSYGGAIQLRKSLEEICQYLLDQSKNKTQLPPVGMWIITQYHFGKDGNESLSGLSFEHTWEEVEGGLKRFYSKHMPDGRIIPRLEQIRTPQRTLDEEIELMTLPLILDL